MLFSMICSIYQDGQTLLYVTLPATTGGPIMERKIKYFHLFESPLEGCKS